MYCEKYRCSMDESACIRRQKNHHITGAYRDPGCLNCSQGKQIMEQFERKTHMPARRKNAPPILRETENGKEKYCPACRAYHPATEEYFYKDNRNKKTGLTSWCIRCQQKANAKSQEKKTGKKSPVKPDDVNVEYIYDEPDNENIIELDFTEREDLLNTIKAAAHDEFRSPAALVMWWIKEYQDALTEEARHEQ